MEPVAIREATVFVDDLELHYREAGDGPPVVLLHGWPTSSLLWRNVMPRMTNANRVIAPDLPGFGASSKPLDASYSFRFFKRALDGFLDAMNVGRTGLVVHDLGGPIGLYWASQQAPGRLSRLSILNTLVYPELSLAAKAFVLGARLPGVRALLTSQWGLKKALFTGVTDKTRLRPDAIETFQAPFESRAARKALAKAGTGLVPAGLAEVADWIRTLTIPVRIIYGARDRILPDIERTVARLEADLEDVETTRFQDCGHFLQEERPEELGDLLAEFFGDQASTSS